MIRMTEILFFLALLPAAAGQALVPLQSGQPDSAAITVAGQCPVATFDMQVNRYVIEPVRVASRSVLELREIRPMSLPCNGPLVLSDLAFQGVHYDPVADRWRAYLPVPDVLDSGEGAAADGATLELCHSISKVCVGLLGPPPPASPLEGVGVWTPRSRTDHITALIRCIGAAFLVYTVGLFVVEMFGVPWLVRKCFNEAELAKEGEEDESDMVGIPSVLDAVIKVGAEIGCMSVATLALLLFSLSFASRRELTGLDVFITIAYPVTMVILHLIAVLGTAAKIMLYNALLKDAIHLEFARRGLINPMNITVLLASLVFLGNGIRKITEGSACDMSHVEDCTPTYLARMYGLKIWAATFPACYCMFLIVKLQTTVEIEQMPLYWLFMGKAVGEQSKVPDFLATLEPVSEELFLEEGERISRAKGFESVAPRAVADAVKALGPEVRAAKLEARRQHLFANWMTVGDSGPCWYVQLKTLWSWRLRLIHSKSIHMDLRLLAFCLLTALFFMTVSVLGALTWWSTLSPKVSSVTTTLGEMNPPFDPNIFSYNVFIDSHITSGTLNVQPDFRYVSRSWLSLISPSAAVVVESWDGSDRLVDVPMRVSVEDGENSEEEEEEALEEREDEEERAAYQEEHEQEEQAALPAPIGSFLQASPAPHSCTASR